MPDAEARKALEKLSPQNRLIEPEEVAAVVVMLAGAAAQGINGQAINIDGGAVMF
jgi:NAD(P)-dependent dehydrogenase (short-subunit alcohol dehydrogenase family)